ncbi:MAG: alpha/beta hydrolase [Synechococcus sp.]
MNKLKHPYSRITAPVSALCLAFTSAMLVASPARSADEISVRFGPFQRAIPVEDLETFVNTGDVPRSLRWYANRLTVEEQAAIRAVLREPLNVETNFLNAFIDSHIGGTLLQRSVALFWGGPNDEALLRALRASLILGSFEEGGLTVMNAVRNYPLSQVRLDLGVALRAVGDLKTFFIDDDRIFAAIQQQGATGLNVSSPNELPADFMIPAEPGPLGWEKREISFSNSVRDPSEVVFADVYLPQDVDTPSPLIVISHGVASNRITFAYLAEHLASHGFAAAVMEHPDTSTMRFDNIASGFAERPNPNLFIERPRDITSLLDALEDKVSQDPAWQGTVSTDGVGIFGHSLGGYTVLAAGGAHLDFEHLSERCKEEAEKLLPFNLSLLLQCFALDMPTQPNNLGDERIAAVLAVNPVSSSLFSPTSMGQLDVPTMMVASSDDVVTPAVEEQIVPFTWLQSEERYLILVKNGTHFSFTKALEDDVLALPPQLIGPDQELARRVMQWTATSFFEAYVNDSSEHQSFLTEVSFPSDTGAFNYAMTRSFTQDDLDAAIRLVE